MTLLYHREALISRPDELSYGVINIQATKVKLISQSVWCSREKKACSRVIAVIFSLAAVILLWGCTNNRWGVLMTVSVSSGGVWWRLQLNEPPLHLLCLCILHCANPHPYPLCSCNSCFLLHCQFPFSQPHFPVCLDWITVLLPQVKMYLVFLSQI